MQNLLATDLKSLNVVRIHYRSSSALTVEVLLRESMEHG
jgi:hypothetical protein